MIWGPPAFRALSLSASSHLHHLMLTVGVYLYRAGLLSTRRPHDAGMCFRRVYQDSICLGRAKHISTGSPNVCARSVVPKSPGNCQVYTLPVTKHRYLHDGDVNCTELSWCRSGPQSSLSEVGATWIEGIVPVCIWQPAVTSWRLWVRTCIMLVSVSN